MPKKRKAQVASLIRAIYLIVFLCHSPVDKCFIKAISGSDLAKKFVHCFHPKTMQKEVVLS